jgi:SAM-dependent methyltransferase
MAARLLEGRTGVLDCLDIGSGNGRDARYLASNGWCVTAVDSSPAAKPVTLASVQHIVSDIRFYPLSSYDLINASLVLPFLPRADFEALWLCLLSALKSGGVIAGHFFGQRDWKVSNGNAWGCDEQEVRVWLQSLQIDWLMPSEGRGFSLAGASVFKQTFAFVATKP